MTTVAPRADTEDHSRGDVDWTADPRFGLDDVRRGSLADLHALIQQRVSELVWTVDMPGGYAGGLFRIGREIARYDHLTNFTDTDRYATTPDGALDTVSGKEWHERPDASDLYDQLLGQNLDDANAAAFALPWILPSLTDLLAEPDVEPIYLVDKTWPHGGKIVFSAPQKAGKTTAVGNIVRALVDSTPMFGDEDEAGGFAVMPLGEGETVWIADFELTRGMFRRWLAEQGVRATERVRFELFRGRTWDIRDARIRADWAQQLRVQKTRIIIVDPLVSVLAPLGIDENNNMAVGGFLHALDMLAREAGVSELLVIHHTGHVGERSRGAAVLRGWPDAEWRLMVQKPSDGREAEPNAPRFFAATGRDVGVPETALAYDAATRRLSLSSGNRNTHVAGQHTATVLELVSANAGLTTRDLEAQLQASTSISTPKVRRIIKAAIDAKEIHLHSAPGRRKLHFPGPELPTCTCLNSERS